MSGADTTGGQPPLRFGADGAFRVLQLTDLHEGPAADPRTTAFLEAVLEDQRPHLVVLTGDLVASDLGSAAELRQALHHVVGPADRRGLPWLVTLGNHDEDHTAATGVDGRGLLELCRAYPHNLNRPGPEGVSGVGNLQLLVLGARGDTPVFNLWALDAGREAPEVIGGQVLAGSALLGWGWMPRWSWIRQDQVAWFAATSAALERAAGRKIPSLLFLHVPLHEHRQMWAADAAGRAAPAGGPGPPHGVTGERNEEECVGAFNSGLFAAALERGDVLGIFCGHDHVNDYVGDYFGVRLGCSASAGFAAYGLGGADDHRLRGARLFTVEEREPWRFSTRMIRASEYGIG